MRLLVKIESLVVEAKYRSPWGYTKENYQLLKDVISDFLYKRYYFSDADFFLRNHPVIKYTHGSISRVQSIESEITLRDRVIESLSHLSSKGKQSAYSLAYYRKLATMIDEFPLEIGVTLNQEKNSIDNNMFFTVTLQLKPAIYIKYESASKNDISIDTEKIERYTRRCKELARDIGGCFNGIVLISPRTSHIEQSNYLIERMQKYGLSENAITNYKRAYQKMDSDLKGACDDLVTFVELFAKEICQKEKGTSSSPNEFGKHMEKIVENIGSERTRGALSTVAKVTRGTLSDIHHGSSELPDATNFKYTIHVVEAVCEQILDIYSKDGIK